MDNSILTTTKILCGIDEECTDFDAILIIHINTVLMVLNQLGVGTKKVFSIRDVSATWRDFLGSKSDVQACTSYVGLKVKMIFDPPTSSVVADATNKLISEMEYRLVHQVEVERAVW